ncbi:MAG: hypothetical protein GW949_08205 [Spirochaetales bacterium]|nr:hypothetical protein [Spirochaetales bacterium]
MSSPLESLVKRVKSIHATADSLSDLLFPWAQENLLVEPVRRSLDDSLKVLEIDPEDWNEEIIHTVGLLRVMEEPRLVSRFLAQEKEFPRPLSGDELQLLNNVLYHEPWSFRLFWLSQKRRPGLFEAFDGATGQEVLVYHPDIDAALSANKELLAGVAVPSGQDDKGLPVFVYAGTFTAYNTLLPQDPVYLLEGLSPGPIREAQDLLPLFNEYAPQFLMLGVFGNLEDLQEEGEDPGQVCWKDLNLDPSALNPDALLALEVDLVRQDFGGWVIFEGSYEDDEFPVQHLLHIFIHLDSNKVILRVVGPAAASAFPVVYSLAARAFGLSQDRDSIISAATGAAAASPNPGRPERSFGWVPKTREKSASKKDSEPEVTIGLIAALAGRDLFRIPIPGPPQAILDALDLEW